MSGHTAAGKQAEQEDNGQRRQERRQPRRVERIVDLRPSHAGGSLECWDWSQLLDFWEKRARPWRSPKIPKRRLVAALQGDTPPRKSRTQRRGGVSGAEPRRPRPN